MLTLETERLTLRNWLESDVSNYMRLAGDVGYNCFAPPGHFLVHSPEEAEEKIQERIELFDSRRLGKFPVFLKSGGEFIGTCGMEPFEFEGRTEVELGYRLCLKYWGCGYAQEAAAAILRYGFGTLNCSRVMAFVLPQNRASVKILEKLGFEYLGEFMHYDLAHRLYEYPRERFRRGSLESLA
jgi:RimJ/RimL family protein N-acetyltransferase